MKTGMKEEKRHFEFCRKFKKERIKELVLFLSLIFSFVFSFHIDNAYADTWGNLIDRVRGKREKSADYVNAAVGKLEQQNRTKRERAKSEVGRSKSLKTASSNGDSQSATKESVGGATKEEMDKKYGDPSKAFEGFSNAYMGYHKTPILVDPSK